MSLTAAGDVNPSPQRGRSLIHPRHSSSSLLPQLSDADIQGYRDAYEPRMDEMHAFNMVKRRLRAGSIVHSKKILLRVKTFYVLQKRNTQSQ